MDSNLDAAILDLRCRDPQGTRGIALMRLMAQPKLFTAVMRELKVKTLEELRIEMLKPIKGV